MKVFRVASVAACALLGLGIAAQERPLGALSEWLETPEGGAALLDPEVVASGHIDGWGWSSDGRKLVCWVTRVAVTSKDVEAALVPGNTHRPRITRAIVVWNSETHKSREIWSDSESQRRVSQCAFLGQTSTVVVHFSDIAVAGVTGELKTQETIALAEGGASNLRVVFRAPNGIQRFAFSASPTQPYAILGWEPVLESAQQTQSPIVFVLDRNGGLRPLRFPPELTAPNLIGWVQDGSEAIFVRGSRDASDTTGPLYYLSNPKSGDFRATTREALFASRSTFRAYEFDESPISFPDVGSDRASVKITMRLWKRDGATGPVISVGVGAAGSADLAPRDANVAYISNGALVVRNVITVQKAVILRLKIQSARVAAMQNAKQVGLAMIMYANDNDDSLPAAGSWQDGIMPYCKSTSVMNDFVYAYAGDLSLANIEKPSETVLGYVQADGGRAVVYADGHVAWVPGPAK